MTFMGCYRRLSNCDYLAFVADFDSWLSIATFVWCREGHSYGAITITVIITITLRIEMLRFKRIIPPFTGGTALSHWVEPSHLRVLFPSLG